MATPDKQEQRRQQQVATQFGSAMQYTRVFAIPKGDVDTFLTTEAAIGAEMNASWSADSFGDNAPVVTSAVRGQQTNSGQDTLVVQFIQYTASDFYYPGPEAF
jgi:hypothetical protein